MGCRQGRVSGAGAQGAIWEDGGEARRVSSGVWYGKTGLREDMGRGKKNGRKKVKNELVVSYGKKKPIQRERRLND